MHQSSVDRDMNQNDRNKVQISLIAGSCSGILSTIILYPMDVIRTKMQTGNCGKGPINVLRHTIQHGGIQALYTGMALPLGAQAVYKGTVFFVNDVTQNLICDFREWRYSNASSTSQLQQQKLTLGDKFWCGFMGGAVNGAIFVTPVELVRNQLIAQHTKLATTNVEILSTTTERNFRGSWDVIRQTFHTTGVRSLWRGIGWTVGRDGIGCGCFFYTIAFFQQFLTPVNESPSFTTNIISGGMAGLAFWVVALPMDSIKTWIQSSELKAKSISVSESVHKMYVENGIFGVTRSLLRGWQVAYGKGIPSAALIVVSYSFVYDGLINIL
jgi:solute carrier family 25 (mitochondrial carnitine/acylcarnitine transporter), member 20/29